MNKSFYLLVLLWTTNEGGATNRPLPHHYLVMKELPMYSGGSLDFLWIPLSDRISKQANLSTLAVFVTLLVVPVPITSNGANRIGDKRSRRWPAHTCARVSWWEICIKYIERGTLQMTELGWAMLMTLFHLYSTGFKYRRTFPILYLVNLRVGTQVKRKNTTLHNILRGEITAAWWDFLWLCLIITQRVQLRKEQLNQHPTWMQCFCTCPISRTDGSSKTGSGCIADSKYIPRHLSFYRDEMVKAERFFNANAREKPWTRTDMSKAEIN